MSVITNGLVALIGAGLGVGHGLRLARDKAVSLDTVHRHTRMPLRGLVLAGLSTALASVAGGSRRVLWALPPCVAQARAALLWGPITLLLGYCVALVCLLAWREGHAKRVRLSVALFIILAALVVLHERMTRPIYAQLGARETRDGVVLQTSPVSCAAASAANIVRLLGGTATEQDMARTLQTDPFGTSYAGIILGLRRLDFTCRKVIVATPEEVHTPAILFVDHPATGPESHVVVLAACQDGQAEILDPLSGRYRMSYALLRTVWHGKAMEVGK